MTYFDHFYVLKRPFCSQKARFESVEPAKTAETINEHGWLYSGDLGTMDAEGYVRITGELYGEAIMAWIQLHQGEQCSEEEILDFCKDQIAHFKIPQYIRFVDDFPMNGTGKLQKLRMRETAIGKLGLKA